MDSSQIETGPLPPAEEKQNTASKQSQLINPLDLLICCVTLGDGGERTGKANSRLVVSLRGPS
jgi:hypothetical protein